MNYPLISEYIEAIKSAEDNFDELSYLRPFLGDDGLPMITSGNFAVVFKMQDERDGKLYAVKCFTKEQEGRAEAYREITKELKDVDSPYLTSVRYLDKELFVDTGQTDETEFPVLLMDWIEGKTLDKYLRENLDDKYALEMLAYRFSQLAQWLIPQSFAHGDLKPDNILVREDGTLVLVDYDGMYVPAMKGQKARELGSPDFRHPLRTENDFDEHIDDFPLMSILLSLISISLNPRLLEEYGATDRLLFSEKDYLNILDSMAFKAVKRLDYSFAIHNLLLIFYQFKSSYCLIEDIDFEHVLVLHEPVKSKNGWRYSQTACGGTNVAEGIEDEYGAIYSKDGKRLLGLSVGGRLWGYYKVKQGTQIICDGAFIDCIMRSIDIPQSIEQIGCYAFSDCSCLQFLKIPSGIDVLRNGLFESCYSLFAVVIPNSVKEIHPYAFRSCSSLQFIDIPVGVTYIGQEIFSGCRRLKWIEIPNSVTKIGNSAFYLCESLKSVKLPEGLTEIEDDTFAGCVSLEEIMIPEGVKYIGNSAFKDCTSLQRVVFPKSIAEVGDNIFTDCTNLRSLYIPKGMKNHFQNLLSEYQNCFKEDMLD